MAELTKLASSGKDILAIQCVNDAVVVGRRCFGQVNRRPK